MCGIAGVSGPFEERAVADALDCIAHRGPDDSGLFADAAAGIALGHRRLSILDLSPLGHQPMSGADGAVVLVYNGEIYNFAELREQLRQRGFTFRGHSDTEVLLNLYIAEGAAMLPRLNGIFAFALWDARTATLLVARDALGVKPLYYTTAGGRFAFASEMKALLRVAPVPRTPDFAALYRYLTFLWCPGDGTPLQAVRRLGPGEAMEVRAGRVLRHWQWYRLPVRSPSAPPMREQEAVQGTAAQLRAAVHRQMVADVPVGAFLSGGLDSSAIVTFARELAPEIRCFTIELAGGQDAGAADDLPYARRVAAHLGVHLDVVTVDAHRMAGDLGRMVEQLDEPLADPSPLNVLYISELARSHGIEVLLSGAGGDDLFTGYRRHRAIDAARYWDWIPQAVRATAARLLAGVDQRREWARRGAKLMAGAALDGDERIVQYFRWAEDSTLLPLCTDEFRAHAGREGAAAPMHAILGGLPAGLTPLERMLALEQRFFLADHNLIYTDRMSMAAGVEVRVPFLDLEMVEFAAAIPPHLRQRGAVGKWVLKEAMAPHLPADVIHRPKTGFGAPLRRWMRHDLRELLGDMLSPDSLRRRGWFEPRAVSELIAANDAGRADAAYTLLSLLCIEMWSRAYLDAAPRPAGGALVIDT